MTTAPDEVSAGVDAKAQGHKVEALSLRTETSQTFVNPDGTETVESTMLPARVKDASGTDGWRDIDLDLKVNADGSISPKSPLYGLTLNGGGAGQAAQPLLTLSDGSSKSLSLGWNRGKLSKPIIDGDTVTYPDVRPNEDLVVTATRTGFEQSLVLNAKPSIAADANIQMPVTAHGLKLKNSAGGQFQITDMAGHAFGGAGPPDITDATTGTTTPSPAADATATMTIDTTASTPELDVTPSTTDLNDAVYPLTIDPTVSFGTPSPDDTYVDSTSPGTNYSTSVYLRSGKSTSGSIYRSYMRWASTTLPNSVVTSANLSIYENSSGTGSGCTTSSVYLYPADGNFAISQATWNSQPSFSHTDAVAVAGTNYGGGTSCAAATFNMDVSTLLQQFANNNDSNFAMQIYSSETSTAGYKQFGSADSSHQPVLTVSYGHRANPPVDYGVVNQQVVSGTYYVNTTSPTIYGTSTNADNDWWTYHVYVYGSDGNLFTSCSDAEPSGTRASCTVSKPLTNGQQYTYRESASADAPSEIFSPTASFVVAGAPEAPTINCQADDGASLGNIADGAWISPKPDTSEIDCSLVTLSSSGSVGTFGLDALQYAVSIDGGAETLVDALPGGMAKRAAWVPISNTDGAHTLVARSIGFSGLSSPPASYGFGLGQTAISPLPNGGRIAGETATLIANAPSAYVNTAASAAHLKWSLDGQNWTPSNVTPTVSVSGGIETATFAWDTHEAIGGTIGSGDDASISVEVVFDAAPSNSAGTLTTPVSHVMRVAHPFGSQYPTAPVGSGTVSLYTGEFTTTSDDVSAPSLGGALSISRTFDSHNPTRTGPSNVFGPGWSAALSDGDDGYAEAAVSYQTNASTLFINDPILSTDLAYNAGSLASLSATTAVTLDATDTTTQQNEVTATVANTGAGTPITLAATELNGTVTTWTSSSPYTNWTLENVAVPSEGAVTTYYSDGTGRIDAIVSHPNSVTSCAATGSLSGTVATGSTIVGELVGNLVPGCTALALVYGGQDAQDTPITPPNGESDPTTRLQSVVSVAYDSTAGSMKTAVLAQYAYDSSGRLAWFDDLSTSLGAMSTTGQITTYTYITGSIGGNPQQLLATEQTNGFAPTTYNYDTTGHAPEGIGDTYPLISVDRGNADGSSDTSRQTTIVYNLPSGVSPLGLSSAPNPQWWGQGVASRPVTSSAAVFGADYVPPATVTELDVRHADVHYMDPTGFQVDTATYGAGAWQYADNEYLTDGTLSYTLSAKDTADAIAWHDAGNTMPFDYASRETITRYYTDDPTTCTPVPANTLVEDVWGPVESAAQASGPALAERQHTHYVYDENPRSTTTPPTAVINPKTQGPFELPTTVTVGVTTPTNYSTDVAYGFGSAAPACGTADPSKTLTPDTQQLAKTTYQYAPLDPSISDTASTSGWVLGRPTVTDHVVGTSTDILTKSAYAANGTEIEHIAPGSTGSDAATTVTHLYDDITDSSAPSACQGHPQWAGLVCQSGPAAQPSSGQPLPVTVTAGYNYWLEPTQVVQTSGTATRTSTSAYLPNGQPDTHTVTASGLTGSTAVPKTKDVYDPTTFLQTGLETLDGSGTVTGTESQAFDQWGRTTSYTNSLGDVTTTSYVPSATPGAGQVAQTIDPKTTTTYSYDGTDTNGQVEHRGLLTGLTVSGVGSYTAGYDSDGNLTKQTLPGGVSEQIGYDAEGNDRPISLTYSGQVTSGGATTTGTWLSYARNYNAAGQVFQDTTPQGISSTPSGYSKQYTYDEADRLTQVNDATDPASGAAGCTVRQYGFDVNGNRTNLTSTPSAAGCVTTGAPTSKVYSYDIANRQTTGANGVGSYVYDSFGRQTTIPAADAPKPAAGNVAVGYYDTDAVRTVTQNGATTTYGLDPDGRRLTAATATAVTTNHYTDGSDNPDWATQVTGSVTQTSVYTSDITGVLGATGISTGGSNSVSLNLADMGGNLVATVPLPVTGNATSVSGYASYDEYGNPETGAISTGADSYGWLGTKQRADDSTGLTLMGARVDNPAMGRFTSVDPILHGNENAYNYPNDPIDKSDITGQSIDICECGSGMDNGGLPPEESSSSGADEVPGAMAGKDIDGYVRSLPRGRNYGTSLAEDEEHLKAIFHKTTKGGTEVPLKNPGAHEQTSKVQPDGTRVTYRTGSRSGGHTIDIKYTSGAKWKVHIK